MKIQEGLANFCNAAGEMGKSAWATLSNWGGRTVTFLKDAGGKIAEVVKQVFAKMSDAISQNPNGVAIGAVSVGFAAGLFTIYKCFFSKTDGSGSSTGADSWDTFHAAIKGNPDNETAVKALNALNKDDQALVYKHYQKAHPKGSTDGFDAAKQIKEKGGISGTVFKDVIAKVADLKANQKSKAA